MNLDETFKEVGEFLFGLRDNKLFCLVNLLIFVKESIGDDR